MAAGWNGKVFKRRSPPNPPVSPWRRRSPHAHTRGSAAADSFPLRLCRRTPPPISARRRSSHQPRRLSIGWCCPGASAPPPIGSAPAPPSDAPSAVIGWGAGLARPRPFPLKRWLGGGGGSARQRPWGLSAAPMELLRKWLGHPEDIYNLLRFKMGGYRAVMPRMDTVSGDGCAMLPVGRGAREEEEMGGPVMSGRGYGVAMGAHPIIQRVWNLPALCASVLPGCTGSGHRIALLVPCMHPTGSRHCTGSSALVHPTGSGHPVHRCIPPSPSIPASLGTGTLLGSHWHWASDNPGASRTSHRLQASLHCSVPVPCKHPTVSKHPLRCSVPVPVLDIAESQCYPGIPCSVPVSCEHPTDSEHPTGFRLPMHCSVPVPTCIPPAPSIPCIARCRYPARFPGAPDMARPGAVRTWQRLRVRRGRGAGMGRVKGRVSGRGGAAAAPRRRRAPMAAGSRAVSVLRRTLTLSPPRKAPRAAGRRRGQQQQQHCGAPAVPPAPPPAAPRLQPAPRVPLCPQDSLGCGLRTCYRYLNQTSRSFAAVIQALDGELR